MNSAKSTSTLEIPVSICGERAPIYSPRIEHTSGNPVVSAFSSAVLPIARLAANGSSAADSVVRRRHEGH
jgi:hypothetical protein